MITQIFLAIIGLSHVIYAIDTVFIGRIIRLNLFPKELLDPESKDTPLLKFTAEKIVRFDNFFDEYLHRQYGSNTLYRFYGEILRTIVGTFIVVPIVSIIIFSLWTRIADFFLIKFFNPKLLPH